MVQSQGDKGFNWIIISSPLIHSIINMTNNLNLVLRRRRELWMKRQMDRYNMYGMNTVNSVWTWIFSSGQFHGILSFFFLHFFFTNYDRHLVLTKKQDVVRGWFENDGKWEEKRKRHNAYKCDETLRSFCWWCVRNEFSPFIIHILLFFFFVLCIVTFLFIFILFRFTNCLILISKVNAITMNVFTEYERFVPFNSKNS